MAHKGLAISLVKLVWLPQLPYAYLYSEINAERLQSISYVHVEIIC